jgi:hypothetical protein
MTREPSRIVSAASTSPRHSCRLSSARATRTWLARSRAARRCSRDVHARLVLMNPQPFLRARAGPRRYEQAIGRTAFARVKTRPPDRWGNAGRRSCRPTVKTSNRTLLPRNADRAIGGIRTKFENSGRRASAWFDLTPVAAFVRAIRKEFSRDPQRMLFDARVSSGERISSGDRVDRSTSPRSRQVALPVARRTGTRRRLQPSWHRREADRARQRRSRASGG